MTWWDEGSEYLPPELPTYAALRFTPPSRHPVARMGADEWMGERTAAYDHAQRVFATALTAFDDGDEGVMAIPRYAPRFDWLTLSVWGALGLFCAGCAVCCGWLVGAIVRFVQR